MCLLEPIVELIAINFSKARVYITMGAFSALKSDQCDETLEQAVCRKQEQDTI
jgi:hypothetical protein